MSDILIPSPENGIPAYLATPTRNGAWPAVMVIHDVFGMTTDLKDQADWLASVGYLAVAPNLFSSSSKLGCIRSAFRDLKLRKGPIFQDLDLVRSWLGRNEGCNGNIGVIGFGMGGGFALLLAATNDYAASAVNYGHVPKDAETLLKGACLIAGSFGGKDRSLKRASAKLANALEAAGVPHDVKEYPQAGHGFMNNHKTVISKAMALLMGGGFHEPSAENAKRRIIAFFDSHLY